MVHREIECLTKGEMFEGGRKPIDGLIEINTKNKVSKSGRKRYHIFVECEAKGKVGNRAWDVFYRVGE